MINFNIDFNLFNNYYYFYERIFILLASLVPTIFLICYVLYTDRKSKEPVKNIVICLLSGFVTIAVSGYLENFVRPFIANQALLIFIWALIEEVTKLSIFYFFISDNRHFDDLYDGLVYMTLIALSFAGLENIMYAFSENTISESISLALMRDITTVPLHVVCGIVIGHFMALGGFSKKSDKKILNYTLALFLPAFIHGLFNNLMNLLASIHINTTSSLLIIFVKFTPLLIVMIILFLIAIKYTKKIIQLNKVFMTDGIYEEKYSYLLTKEEYLDLEYNPKKKRRKRKIDLEMEDDSDE